MFTKYDYRTVRQCAESLRNDLPPESESSNQLQELVFDLRTDTMRTILKQVKPLPPTCLPHVIVILLIA